MAFVRFIDVSYNERRRISYLQARGELSIKVDEQGYKGYDTDELANVQHRKKGRPIKEYWKVNDKEGK